MKRRRYLIDDSMHPIFVTTTIVGWAPIFSDFTMVEYALNLLEKVRYEHRAIIYGYVLMPNHLHMTIQTHERGHLSAIMKKWKSVTAIHILDYCRNNDKDYWLKIFGDNIVKYNLSSYRKHQIWQPRFDEKAIRDEREFLAKLNYMHGNPIKHNLVGECGDYPYSSYSDYTGKSNGFIAVQIGYFGIDKLGKMVGRGHNKL